MGQQLDLIAYIEAKAAAARDVQPVSGKRGRAFAAYHAVKLNHAADADAATCTWAQCPIHRPDHDPRRWPW